MSWAYGSYGTVSQLPRSISFIDQELIHPIYQSCRQQISNSTSFKILKPEFAAGTVATPCQQIFARPPSFPGMELTLNEKKFFVFLRYNLKSKSFSDSNELDSNWKRDSDGKGFEPKLKLLVMEHAVLLQICALFSLCVFSGSRYRSARKWRQYINLPLYARLAMRALSWNWLAIRWALMVPVMVIKGEWKWVKIDLKCSN